MTFADMMRHGPIVLFDEGTATAITWNMKETFNVFVLVGDNEWKNTDAFTDSFVLTYEQAAAQARSILEYMQSAS